MGIFNNTPISKPYVVEFEDGTEAKVDAYDIQEACMAGAMKRNQENTGDSPAVIGIRPDADRLKQRAAQDGMVRKLVESIQVELAGGDEAREQEERE